MTTRWLVNGENQGVQANDRGLAYGDGLFETMAARDGQIRWLDLHLERLLEGCSRLAITPPSLDTVREEIASLVPSAGRVVVKLIVTRGAGSRGYAPPVPHTPTRVVMVTDWPDYPDRLYRDGIAMRVCELRLGENPRLAGIKHLNRLEHVLAQLELKGQGVEQGLLLDSSACVVGGTSSNVFVVERGTVVTPPLERCGVRGVMRRAVLASAGAVGLQVAERELTLEATLAADEVFVTNALFGIWPVAAIDARQFAVGPVTRRLQRHFELA